MARSFVQLSINKTALSVELALIEYTMVQEILLKIPIDVSGKVNSMIRKLAFFSDVGLLSALFCYIINAAVSLGLETYQCKASYATCQLAKLLHFKRLPLFYCVCFKLGKVLRGNIAAPLHQSKHHSKSRKEMKFSSSCTLSNVLSHSVKESLNQVL